jgi:O-antigen/teichoic acid export membrane protein
VASPVGLFRKAGWNIVDQALSALSNTLLSVIVARSVNADGFGAFSVAFVVFGIALALTRSVVGSPLQIRFSSHSGDSFSSAVGRASGLAVLLGVATGILCLCAGLLLGGVSGAALVALAVILPGLLLQDTCRMAFFARGDARSAALIDAVWSVVQVAILAALIWNGQRSVGPLVLAWGAAAAVSAVLGFKLLRCVPRPRQAFEWMREQRDVTRYLFAEYFLGLGASQIAILLVGVIAASSAVGSLRAAQVLLGPLAIVGVAAFQFAMPEFARRPDLSSRRRWWAGLGLSGLLGSVTICYLTLLLLIPDRLGVQLFGDSWEGASAVLLAMGLSSLASSLANGPACVLYGMGLAKNTFRINLAKAPILLLLVLTGTWLWGAVGAAWGLAAVEAMVLPLWVLTLRRALNVVDHTPPVRLTDDDQQHLAQ